MITEELMYGVSCDHCGKEFEDESTGWSFWNEKSATVDNATDCGWLEHEGKHYCPDCHRFNDEDELVLTPAATAPPDPL